jgi:serine/threonine protein kinase
MVVEPRGLSRWGPAYTVRDPEDARDYVLQLLSDTAARTRLEAEVNLQSELLHPNIVTLTVVVDEGDCFGVVYDLVDGPSLRDLLGDGAAMEAAETMLVFDQVRSAVQAAHDASVLHLSLTPEEIFLCEQPSGIAARVVHFGLMRSLQTRPDADRDRYSAPEMAQNSPDRDARVDVYALGCILYEMLTGQPRFTAAYGANAIGDALVREVEGCPAFVLAAIERAVAREPADRFPDLVQFDAALKGAAPLEVVAEPPQPTPPEVEEAAETTPNVDDTQDLPDPMWRAVRLLAQLLVAPSLVVGGILYIGAYVAAGPLTRTRAAAQLADAALAAELTEQIQAGKQLILWGAQPAQIENTIAAAEAAHSLSDRIEADRSLSEALLLELHRLRPAQSPEEALQRRAIERRLETDHGRISLYSEASEALNAAQSTPFAPFADALGLSGAVK